MFWSRVKKNLAKNIKFFIESNSMLFWRKGQKFSKERSFDKANISQKFTEIENLRLNEMKKFLQNKKQIENLLQDKQKEFILLIQDLQQFKNFENLPSEIKTKISEIEQNKDYKNIKKSFEKSQNKNLKDFSDYKIKKQSESIKKIQEFSITKIPELQTKISQINSLFPKIASLNQIIAEDKKNIQKLSVN